VYESMKVSPAYAAHRPAAAWNSVRARALAAAQLAGQLRFHGGLPCVCLCGLTASGGVLRFDDVGTGVVIQTSPLVTTLTAVVCFGLELRFGDVMAAYSAENDRFWPVTMSGF
jgi:hypothetical protein